jgi:broad specificity phosphatase PhoE
VLILVRHAMPAAEPDVPPSEWTLSPDGLRAAAAMRKVLPRDAWLVSSPAPKARQTLGDSDDLVYDGRFREVDRPVEPWSDDFRTTRAEYVTGARHRGWEPQAEVAERFAAGVAVHADAGPRPVVVATHGMAMTVWLVSVGALADTDAADFWRGLRFPDCHLIDLEANTVRRWPPAARMLEQDARPDHS